tara:strand:- start:1393 stop:1650 length:258 start_codon:yes stop_codon:yes gene_type:complete
MPDKTPNKQSTNKPVLRKKRIIKKRKKKKVTEVNTEKKSTKEIIEEYISTLSELELKTMEIASTHLKTSFNIEKSIGYKKWLATI